MFSYSLNEVGYIRFDDFLTNIEAPSEIGNKLAFTVFPNPVNYVLRIDLSNFADKIGALRVLSLDGRIVLTQQTQGESVETLSLEALPNNMYFCQFTNKNEVKTVKIIKD